MIRLLALALRRDRIVLLIWILGIALLVLLTTVAVSTEFGDEKDREGVLALALATPSLLALRGAPNGAGLGATIFFQQFAFTAVAVGLMNTFLATRHGRADEERGRRELVGASPVRRSAGLAATLLLGLLANLALGVLATAAFVAGGLDLPGSATAGAAYAATGLAFLGIGVLAGEMVATSRAANGIGAIAVLVAYALRAAGDALGNPDFAALRLDAAWPSWLSPIGWGEQTFAFSDDRPGPLLLSVGLAALTTAVAVAIHARREIGESLLPERVGRAAAGPTLRSNLGLVWRLQWPSLLGWAVGAVLLGASVASLARVVEDATLENENIARVLASLGHGAGADVTGTFLVAVMGMVGILAAAAGIQAALRARAEEAEGRAEGILATPISRARWLADALVAGVLSVAAVLLGTAAAVAAAFALAGDAENAARAAGQTLVQAPAALVFVAVAAALVGILPRVAVALSWGVFALAIAIGLFGELLDLPDPVLDASPITQVPAVPVEDWTPTGVLVGVVALLLLLALAGVRRRDLVT
jgi:ABC-2 type transport system permease protein